MSDPRAEGCVCFSPIQPTYASEEWAPTHAHFVLGRHLGTCQQSVRG